jgi:hypothetical protein
MADDMLLVQQERFLGEIMPKEDTSERSPEKLLLCHQLHSA